MYSEAMLQITDGVCIYVFMNVFMYVYMYVCLYVCMYEQMNALVSTKVALTFQIS